MLNRAFIAKFALALGISLALAGSAQAGSVHFTSDKKDDKKDFNPDDRDDKRDFKHEDKDDKKKEEHKDSKKDEKKDFFKKDKNDGCDPKFDDCKKQDECKVPTQLIDFKCDLPKDTDCKKDFFDCKKETKNDCRDDFKCEEPETPDCQPVPLPPAAWMGVATLLSGAAVKGRGKFKKLFA